jgi:hypothetical protein
VDREDRQRLERLERIVAAICRALEIEEEQIEELAAERTYPRTAAVAVSAD